MILWTLTPTDSGPALITFDYADVDFIGGQIVLIYNDEAVRQDVIQSLLFFMGEWFLDIRLGVPWFQHILGSKRTQFASHLLRRVVEEVPGIDVVQSFNVNFDHPTRTLSIGFEARLKSGTILTVEDQPFIYQPMAA